MIQVFVIAPTGLACDAIATALKTEPDIEVVGQTTGYGDPLPTPPQGCVVLVDVGAPNREALSEISRLAREPLDARIVVLGVPDVPGIVLDYVEAGAHAYVRRDESIAGLVAQIRAVARGEAVIPPAMAGLLARRVAGLSRLCADKGIEASRTLALSAREREVLELLARGHGNQEIARRLGIGVGTVKNHVHSILRKLNVSHREDAGLYWRLFSIRNEGP